jgi:hypothetical protein
MTVRHRWVAASDKHELTFHSFLLLPQPWPRRSGKDVEGRRRFDPSLGGSYRRDLGDAGAMRFMTTDGLSGVVLVRTPDHDSRFFSYQLIIDRAVIGDRLPCIPWGGLQGLAQLGRLDHPRLSPTESDPDTLLAVLAEDAFHDIALRPQSAESFDGWEVRGYRHGDSAILLARGPEQPTVQAVVPDDEFREVVEAAIAYLAEVTG